MNYITPKLFELVSNEDTKIAKRVYNNVLNADMLEVVLDGDVFWIEQVSSLHNIPDYAYKYVISLLESKGYRYLYHIA